MSKPLVKNASDEGQVREAAQRAKREREHELQDISMLMGSRPGRRLAYRLLSMCNVYKSSFNLNGSLTNFNEGMRQVGLNWLADINEAAPEQYLVMLKEAKESEDA